MAIPKRTPTTTRPAEDTEATEAVTLEQALKEEGENRTPETIAQEDKKLKGPSKADRARKIMEEMWDDLLAGKVKRKDVIQRFLDEAGLKKAGASTYYGTIKKRMTKPASAGFLLDIGANPVTDQAGVCKSFSTAKQ